MICLSAGAIADGRSPTIARLRSGALLAALLFEFLAVVGWIPLTGRRKRGVLFCQQSIVQRMRRLVSISAVDPLNVVLFLSQSLQETYSDDEDTWPTQDKTRRLFIHIFLYSHSRLERVSADDFVKLRRQTTVERSILATATFCAFSVSGLHKYKDRSTQIITSIKICETKQIGTENSVTFCRLHIYVSRYHVDDRRGWAFATR